MARLLNLASGPYLLAAAGAGRAGSLQRFTAVYGDAEDAGATLPESLNFIRIQVIKL